MIFILTNTGYWRILKVVRVSISIRMFFLVFPIKNIYKSWELVYGTHYGIGYYILDVWTRIDYISMYAGIIIISLLGFFIFISIDILEEIICKWKQTSQQEGF